MNRLPFLISIPHGGTGIPPELTDSINLTDQDIFEDSDPFTKEIYAAHDFATAVCMTDIARAFIDLNRSVDQLPPVFPDGLIKSVTCFSKPVYKEGAFPDKQQVKMLIEKYYSPYHNSLKSILDNREILMAFDCHSMVETGPPVSPDMGERRPLVNLGDAEGKACDPKITILLQSCIEGVFGISHDEVSINRPFKGGYITRTYGNKPVSWIQIELNRILYLSAPWFDPVTRKIDTRHLQALNRNFILVLEMFHQEMMSRQFYTRRNDK